MSGCRVINPPAYLSEDEARQVIEQEAKKAGISFKPSTKTVSVAIPETDPWSHGQTKPAEPGGRKHALRLDGIDRTRAVSYEFVSQSDFWDWLRKGAIGPTVYGICTVDAARVLRDELLKARLPGRYAVFYDPLVSPRVSPNSLVKEQGDRIRRETVVKEKEELREQVRDFIKWLKAEGVI